MKMKFNVTSVNKKAFGGVEVLPPSAEERLEQCAQAIIDELAPVFGEAATDMLVEHLQDALVDAGKKVFQAIYDAGIYPDFTK